MRKFRITHHMDAIYCVRNSDYDTPTFYGNLSDCDAYIRLHEGGYFI